MKSIIEILEAMPREELKILVSRGIVRRNAVREMQAVAVYQNLTQASNAKSVTVAREVSKRFGLSERTFFRVLNLYK